MAKNTGTEELIARIHELEIRLYEARAEDIPKALKECLDAKEEYSKHVYKK